MLPYTGHHMAREKEADQEQHGGNGFFYVSGSVRYKGQRKMATNC